MDEIVIDDKKYLSSKRAAKVTGYAKDYVGQLCREGRVKARLVGRSWYVLESSIKDHKAGELDGRKAKVIASKAKVQVSKSSQAETHTDIPITDPNLPVLWQAPRYETYIPEMLPSINLIKKEPSNPPPVPASGNSNSTVDATSQVVNDAWKAWFNNRPIPSPTSAMDKHVELMSTSEFPDVPPPTETAPQRIEPEVSEETENIALHIVEEDTFIESAPPQTTSRPRTRRKGRGMRIIVRAIFSVVALVFMVVAAINSGYLDQYLNTYVDSHPELTHVTGSSIYNE